MTQLILPLETKRLILRPFRLTDADAFQKWRDDPVVARLTLWDHPYPPVRAYQFCEKMAAAEPFPRGGWYQMMIEDRESGQGVGDIGIGRDVHGVTDGAYIGYSLSRAAWGKGYMGEALRALLPVIVQTFSLKSLHATIDARNDASGRVLEKLGFERSALKEKAAFVKGEWCDEYDYYRPATGIEGLTSR